MLAEQRPSPPVMPCRVSMLLKLGLAHTATTPALSPIARQRRHSPAQHLDIADIKHDGMYKLRESPVQKLLHKQMLYMASCAVMYSLARLRSQESHGRLGGHLRSCRPRPVEPGRTPGAGLEQQRP